MSLTICKGCGAESSETWSAGACPRCGGTEAVSVAPKTLEGRTVAGRFQVKHKLGEGGMGAVYEAWDLKLQQRAAVKFLHQSSSDNVELARRFVAEARTYARIGHPGAVTLHDFGQDSDGTLYIAMELVEGQNLRALLDARRRLPLPEAAGIVLQVANVLEAAHEKGVVHRDLKPENVMVREALHGWSVKVLDFGVARRIYDGASRLTAAGAVAGTPRYMAPEQLRASPDVDGRADVYALGLLTFELVTGTPPNGPLSAVGAVDPALHHPHLDIVLDRATHPDPGKRYPSMRELAAALSSAAKVEGPPPPLPPAVPASTGAAAYAKVTPFQGERPVPATGGSWFVWLPLALLVAATGYSLMKRQAVAAPLCAGSDIYTPQLRALSTAELERRVGALPIMRPSDARKQLATLRVTAEGYAAEQRECMYRAMLMGSVNSAQTLLKTQPALWGHTQELGRLRSLFLEVPLTKGWSPEQRQAVLDKVETTFIPHLAAADEADRDFWRRQYLGLELLCEATDDALETLHTQRPGGCLNLEP